MLKDASLDHLTVSLRKVLSSDYSMILYRNSELITINMYLVLDSSGNNCSCGLSNPIFSSFLEWYGVLWSYK